MSAGNGYEYLLKSVRNADLDAPPPGRAPEAAEAADAAWVDPVVAYYAEAGTPPGFWLGAAVQDLGDGELSPGDGVTATHLQRLLGAGVDPVTTEPLGRRYPKYKPVGERIAERVAGLGTELSAEERQAAVDAITVEEVAAGDKTATAGFDLTFSVPKSVSVLWGLSDRTVQALILAAHHQAVAETIAFLEDHIASTRVGTDAGDGSIVHVDVTGLVAMAYDHWDSRSHDPQLHTHLVVANKVRAVVDGKWRTLDSRALFNSNVAFSEHYNAILADRLTSTLGVTWSHRKRGRDRNLAFEIDGVPDDLIAEFSSRSAEIEHCADALIRDYREQHGRQPSRRTVVKLRAQATLATRPPKTLRSLGDLTGWWHERATRILGQDSRTWARNLLATAARRPGRMHTAVDVPVEKIEDAAAAVLTVVGDKRATWRHWNLWAEAERQTMTWRFHTNTDRVEAVARVVAEAEGGSVALTPPDLAPTPAFLLRKDRTSSLRPKHATVYTSEAVLAAERRLLDLSTTRTAPTADGDLLGQVVQDAVTQHVVSRSQADAVLSITGSGLALDVLVGPAGTGKTTTMRLLRAVWEHQHGAGSVVGLAPSAAAAEVLAGELGIGSENTAKWLHDHTPGRTRFRPGQLVIVDEASLAGTHTLDHIIRHAHEAGAKVLLVGDPAQLSAVETGGAFNLLITERKRTTGDVPELTEVHRFTNEWEKAASLRLRDGYTSVLAVYEEHGRIQAGSTEEVTQAAYESWKTDSDDGKVSVLIAADGQTVTDLNRRARAERVLAGTVDDGRAARLAGDVEASAGDVIVTRRNDRRLRHGRSGWVRNGNLWQVAQVHRDGSVTARRLDRDGEARKTLTSSNAHGTNRARENAHAHRENAADRHEPVGGTVRLPAAYLAEHVDLGYAITAHRAQGVTVDTAYTVATPNMTREALYVPLTRGRDTNIVFVAVDQTDHNHDHAPAAGNADHGIPDPARARAVLAGILARTGAEPTAHETRRTEEETYTSIARLAAEYDTIATLAQKPRWGRLVAGTLLAEGFTEREVVEVLEAETFGPLCAELRRAEADGHQVDDLLPRLAHARSLYDADDVAAVLHGRVEHATARPAVHRPSLIAGLVPEAHGPLPDDVREALDARAHLIEQRARDLAARALRDREPWTLGLPPRPAGGAADYDWRALVASVAAYRDRYAVTGDAPLGDAPTTLAQRHDARRVASRLRVVSSAASRDSVRRTVPGRAPSGPAM
ncbi:relaxase domain-containing protein [Antribacter sp. KLBMP9083]|uniref:Relaxase domain-containing protein n=2 Tax=Antribacter soli TaxID=2910976 RepID=A0AA41QAN8_9MICO|nr:relaxase domain-containing protein [Antribacter soli]